MCLTAMTTMLMICAAPPAQPSPVKREPSMLPSVAGRDAAFARAGLESVLSDRKLDQMDRDLLYLWAQRESVAKLRMRFPWLSEVQIEALKAQVPPPRPGT